jgi:hypothetical protein
MYYSGDRWGSYMNEMEIERWRERDCEEGTVRRKRP